MQNAISTGCFRRLGVDELKNQPVFLCVALGQTDEQVPQGRLAHQLELLVKSAKFVLIVLLEPKQPCRQIAQLYGVRDASDGWNRRLYPREICGTDECIGELLEHSVMPCLVLEEHGEEIADELGGTAFRELGIRP